MKVFEAIRHGSETLKEHGVDQPTWNSERCLMVAIGTDRVRLYAGFNEELSADQIRAFENLIHRRALHYPLAYIEGFQEFCGQLFAVNEHVLIPRPETVEIIRAARALRLHKDCKVMDLGAGSGALCATLATELPDAEVFAVEISAAALPVLRNNTKGRVHIVRADHFALPFLPHTFDLITANPPYVEQKEYALLSPETRWEPQLALLTHDLETTYRELLRSASAALKPGGWFIFEIGFGQKERIEIVCNEFKEFQLTGIRYDAATIPRAFILQRQ